jgi:hypothetical protein
VLKWTVFFWRQTVVEEELLRMDFGADSFLTVSLSNDDWRASKLRWVPERLDTLDSPPLPTIGSGSSFLRRVGSAFLGRDLGAGSAMLNFSKEEIVSVGTTATVDCDRVVI